MQALIDFNGWRAWKDIAQEAEAQEKLKAAARAAAKSKKGRSSLKASS